MESSSSNFATEADGAQLLRADLPPNKDLRPTLDVLSKPPRPPLWLSTTSYFLIAAGITLSLFFIISGLLHDENDGGTPWVFAGIAASLMMSLAVAAREVVLRRAQTRYLLLHDKSISSIAPQTKVKIKNKFTLEKNAFALRSIQIKADEANSVLATTENHLEVFKAAQEYLELIESELQKVQPGSPRLPAFRAGQEAVKALHKYHLLRWVSEKTHRLMREVADLVLVDEKIEAAHCAIEKLEFALKFYPDEPQLIESSVAISEFTTLIRVTHWVELAERAAFKKQYRRAINYYQDALFYLSRKSINKEEYNLMTTNIEREIERLNLILSRNKPKRKKNS